jgi:hypothetical protein
VLPLGKRLRTDQVDAILVASDTYLPHAAGRRVRPQASQITIPGVSDIFTASTTRLATQTYAHNPIWHLPQSRTISSRRAWLRHKWVMGGEPGCRRVVLPARPERHGSSFREPCGPPSAAVAAGRPSGQMPSV